MNETEDIESQGHEIRSLIDLEDSEDANNFFEERRDSETEESVVAKVFNQHQLGVQEMINSGNCIAYEITRTDDNVNVEDMAEENFPPALSPDSFARKIGDKQARLLRENIGLYASKAVHKIAIQMGETDCSILS